MTLLVAITMVMLAALASVYSTRSVLIDRLASHHQNGAMQAQLMAEAALAWSRAELFRQFTMRPDNPDVWDPTAKIACPTGYGGPRWQCSELRPPTHPNLPNATTQVVAVRDLVTSPHVTELHASASLPSQNSRGLVQDSVFVPTVAPLPTGASEAALVLNGCANPAAGATVTVCPLAAQGTACSGASAGHTVHSFWTNDLDGNGLISAVERSKCLAFLPEHLPGGGDLTGPVTAMPRAACNHAAWKNVLGDITPAQVKAWSDAQERNGLHALSQPPRSIYWVDSPATWTQSLGQPDAPVLLVFSAAACSQRCPSLASGVRISGTVVLQSQCQDEKTSAWRAGQIEGQLVVESGLPDLQSGSHIQARIFDKPAHQVFWPAGMDVSKVQRVPGSWRETSR